MLWLITEVAIEVVLGSLIFFVGGMWFWQPIKGRQFYRKCAQNQEFLDDFIRRLNEEEPFSSRTRDMEPFQGNWSLNILLVLKSSSSAFGALQFIGLVLSVLPIVVSYFLGLPFLIVNLGLFFFWLFPGPMSGAGNEALKQLYSVASIAFRWRKEDPGSYMNFLQQAWALGKIDIALQRHAS